MVGLLALDLPASWGCKKYTFVLYKLPSLGYAIIAVGNGLRQKDLAHSLVRNEVTSGTPSSLCVI